MVCFFKLADYNNYFSDLCSKTAFIDKYKTHIDEPGKSSISDDMI